MPIPGVAAGLRSLRGASGASRRATCTFFPRSTASTSSSWDAAPPTSHRGSRGARPVGIDLSENQLATARALQDAHHLHFPLIQCSAEAVPLADASFDLAISEYGAAIWCDPYRWIPEAARLLRPGGRLIFLGSAALLVLTMTDSDAEGPAGTTLRRDYFGMHRFEWDDDESVEFHLNHGDWIRLLRGSGFEIEDLVELRPSADAKTRYPFVTLEWARRWPSEEVWVARLDRLPNHE